MVFDLKHSFPLAARILKEELGVFGMLHCFLCFGWRQLWQKPFAALQRQNPISPAEALTRHQLEPVLILDAVLGLDLKLSQERTRSVLKRIVGESGARFIQFAVKNPPPEAWHQKSVSAKNEFAQKGLQQFFNAEAEVVSAPNAHFAFDVKACHFVGLARELGRPDLAPLFCGADETLFNRPELKVLMTREETLAQGHDRCAFRFQWDESETSD
ncbi:MAG: hypothetical protein CMH56_01410 [Myxococcales bacterium]|nr:hypothetical protein [Myxococcales bacterium]|tara:strand:- start:4 stop:645 length:642 start_codon:yes stop_codon:yes gene_type:complete